MANRRSIRLRNETGDVVVDLRNIRARGGRLIIDANLMGHFPSEINLDTWSFSRTLGMLLRPGLLLFMLFTPFFFVRDHIRRGSPTRLLVSEGMVFVLSYLVVLFLIVAAIVGLLRIFRG